MFSPKGIFSDFKRNDHGSLSMALNQTYLSEARSQGRAGGKLSFPISMIGHLGTPLFFAVLLWFAFPIGGIGDEGPSSAKSVDKQPSRPVQLNREMTFWLFGDDGKWRIPLPNWSVADVMRMVDTPESSQPQNSYTVESINVQGTVRQGIVELTAEFRVITVGEAPIEVPLGLNEGVLIPSGDDSSLGKEPFLYEGPGSCRIDIDHTTGGYVAVLSPRTSEIFTPSVERSTPETELFKPVSLQSDDEPKAESEPVPSTEESSEEPSQEESSQEESSQGAQGETVPEDGGNGASVFLDAEEPSTEEPGTEEPGTASTATQPRQEITSGEEQGAQSEQVEQGDSPLPLPLLESFRDQEKPSEQGLLLGRKQHRHTLTLHLLFKAAVVGGNEYQLKATFAPAASSRLRLEVPIPDVQLSVSEGTLALPPVNLNETTSEIVLNGLNRTGKPTELFWWKREDRQADTQKILQIEDALITATLGDQQIQYDVVYPVRVFGGGTDLLKITLPPYTRIPRDSVVVTTTGGASVPVRDIKENDPDQRNSSVEIRLAQEVQEGFTVQFRAAISDPKPSVSTPSHTDVWELGGFSIQGAQKQTGHMTVRLPKETGFLLLPQMGIRTENKDATGLGSDEERFVFFTQPFSLAAQKIERQARTSVAPEMQLQVHQQYIQLFSQFHFTIHGGTVSEFRFHTADWHFNSFKPDNIIDVGRIYTDEETNELVLPLLVPTEGDVVIQLSATREIEDENLVVSFPVCVCDWSDPEPVVVIPDDDIELIPQEENMRNLLPRGTRTLKLEMDIPGRQQIPLVYQTQHFGSADDHPYPVFAATARHHEQKIESTLETEVLLTEDTKSNQIRQTWTCRISYEALREITLQVPSELRENTSFTLTVNGKQVTPQDIQLRDIQSPDNPGEGDGSPGSTLPGGEDTLPMLRKRVVFPDGEQIGICTITLQYPLRNTELLENLTNWIRLPLASCEEGSLLIHRLAIRTRQGVQIELAEDASDWMAEEYRAASMEGSQEYHFYTDKKSMLLPIHARVSAREALGSTVVERVWIQTWLIGRNRFERIAARVISGREQFLVKLPPSVRRDRTEIRIDGAPYPDTSDHYSTSGELVIHLTNDQRHRPVTLEISYLIQSDPELDSGTLTLPEFLGHSLWVRRCYWQVILPETRHIVGTVPNWTPEYYDTAWSSLRFRRVASMGTRELGNWVGITLPDTIPERTNVYLFGSFAPPSSAHLRIIDRSILVLFGSGIVLIFALGFLYLPIVRYQVVVVVLLTLAAAVFVYQPVIILGFLQTAVCGFVLALLAFVIRRFVGRPHAEIQQPQPQEIQDDSTSGHSHHSQERGNRESPAEIRHQRNEDVVEERH